jgi:hypothetical protein
MRHVAMLVAVLVLAPAESRALFHLSHISEVMSGVNGDPSVQYVEIRMNAGAQSFVHNTFLTAFSCDGTSHTLLLHVPSNVANAGANVKWIMATPSFAAAAGITPDFTWDPMTGSIDPTCGMVCWGARGVLSPMQMPVPSAPDDFVDCVGYGGYSGPTKTDTHDGTPTSGTASALAPGDGTQSLTRTGFTGNNAADFVLAAKTPTNNAGMTGFGGGGGSTTTTTPGSSTTTTTTTAPGACADIAACRIQVTGVLPSPASAESGKARKVAVKLGKLFTRAGNALDRAATLTGRKQQKQFKKARAALNKLLTKARAADAHGALAAPLGPLEEAVTALLSKIL